LPLGLSSLPGKITGWRRITKSYLPILPGQAHNRQVSLSRFRLCTGRRLGPTLRQRKFTTLKFFVNGVLKFARGLKWALVGLSEYPGLHFLHRPADALGEYISNYDLAIERAERAKQQVET